jgi:type VI secretion system protein ImpB
MPRQSFQNEIPPARINIQLSVDTGGAQKKMELPMKLLVMGDFSQREDSSRIAEREKINIDKNNFDSVMESMGLSVQMSVENRLKENGTEFPVDLQIRSLRSFEPIEIVRQIPALNRLLAARNLIRDLGSNLLDNREFRKRMEQILRDKPKSQGIQQELRVLSNFESLTQEQKGEN